MRRLVEATLLEDLVTHQPLPQVPDDLNQYTGHYYPASVRFGRQRWLRGEARSAKVTLGAEGLEFELGQRRTRLIPLGQGRFIRPRDPAVTVIFARDEHGTLHLQGELGNFVNLSSGPCPGFLEHCE
jgi:hypothetical protein